MLERLSGLNDRKVELVIGRGGGHWYKVEGHPVLLPSVTTITGATIPKPQLGPWMKKMALDSVRKELSEMGKIELGTLEDPENLELMLGRASRKPDQLKEDAADLGTKAHGIIERILKGENPAVPDDVAKPVAGFLDWHSKTSLEISLSEIRVFSLVLGVAGSMDALGTRDGSKLVVLDWKTSKAIYPDMAYQVGGYATCVTEMTGVPVEEAWIVRFPKFADDPIPFEAKRVLNLKAAQDGFALCKAMWDNAKIKQFDKS